MSDQDTNTPRSPDGGDPSPNVTLLSEGENALMQSVNTERSCSKDGNTSLAAENMPVTIGVTSADSSTGTSPHIPEFHEELPNPEQSTEVPGDHSSPSRVDMNSPSSAPSVRAVKITEGNNLADPGDDLNSRSDSEVPPEAPSSNDTPEVGKEMNNDSKNEEDVQELTEGTSQQCSETSSTFFADLFEEVPSPETATTPLPEDVNDDSASRLEWIRQKREEGAVNKVLDEVMCLVGREEVKEKFLSAKAVVEARRMRGEDLGSDALMYTVSGPPGSGVDTLSDLWDRFEKIVLLDRDEITVSEWHGPHFDCKLHDYSDGELHILLNRLIEKRSLKAEGGIGGLYTKLLSHRIGRERGSSTFGNFWTVRDTFSEVCRRQAERLYEERRAWKQNSEQSGPPDEHWLTMEDMLGKPPIDPRDQSKAYSELHAMTGMMKIKKSVNDLASLARVNYALETQGRQQIQTSLNRVFLGPPGTGKTTVAKLFGQILCDLGLVSAKKVVMKGPSDFSSTNVGGEFENTSEILESTEGAVLIIDDATGLCPTDPVGRTKSNMDKALHNIFDTIVAKTSTEPGQARSIIFVGYKDEMHDMFEKCNAGLRSRFPLEDAFDFPDYELPELMQILDSKLVKDSVEATTQAKEVAFQVLAKMRDRPKFGNGRDVHNLVNRARSAHRQRMEAELKSGDGTTDSWLYKPVLLEPQDFDSRWNRGTTGAESCEDLFRNFVGFESIVQQFQGYQHIALGLRLHGKDPRPHIPFTFIFKGPPGTGKTSTARKLGQIFYDMGFLASEQVIECSVTDLIGEYVGHTGPRVQAMLEKALGKVLFIDEAYRLAGGSRGSSGSSFEEEAVGELVDSLTKPKYARKIIIILAGYSEDMDKLMKSNRGLRGRFVTEVVFPQLSPRQCISFLGQLIGKMDIIIRDRVAPTAEEKEKVNRLFKKLTATRDWSNGRDIESLAEFIVGEVFRKEGMKQKASGCLQVSTVELIAFLQHMLRSRLAGELHDRDSV